MKEHNFSIRPVDGGFELFDGEGEPLIHGLADPVDLRFIMTTIEALVTLDKCHETPLWMSTRGEFVETD